MANMREKMRQKQGGLEKSHKEAVDNKDKNFMTSGSVIDKKKLPEGVEIWRPKKDMEHEIDILAWFATEDYPSDKVQVDDPVHILDLWVYRGVGANDDQFVSPSAHFKKADPIMEYLRSSRDRDEWKKHRAKRRGFYLVWVHDTPEEEAKGVQVFEVAHWFFGEKVEAIAKKPRGGGYILYSAYDKKVGKRICFEIKGGGSYVDANGNEQEGIQWVGHRFVDREEDIPDKILDQIFPLESVINLHPSYEEIYESFYGMPYKDSKDTVKQSHPEKEKDIPYEGQFDDDAPEKEDPTDDVPFEPESEKEEPDPEPEKEESKKGEPESGQLKRKPLKRRGRAK